MSRSRPALRGIDGRGNDRLFSPITSKSAIVTTKSTTANYNKIILHAKQPKQTMVLILTTVVVVVVIYFGESSIIHPVSLPQWYDFPLTIEMQVVVGLLLLLLLLLL